MNRVFQLVLLLCSFQCALSQELNVVPAPADVQLRAGEFVIKQPIVFIYNKRITPGDGGVNGFIAELRKKGFTRFIKGNKHSNNLPTEIFIDFDKTMLNEEYKIIVNPRNILVRGNANGIFYAFQTLAQMITGDRTKGYRIPHGTITDQPRFKYRGMHLDVGRHFFPVDYIKRYIDYLAFHKFNNFHWHLTEDQGWRIEIDKFPKLTEVGSCRAQTLAGRYGSDKYDSTRYCGFYTKKQIREIVRYAADRYINVIPEIDMPGHSVAALASYPYLGCTKGPYKVFETWGVQPEILCAGNDSTYKFVEGVLDEVMDLFPSKFIHIGGDEAPKDRWKMCPVCQARMAKEGLKNEEELQSYFIRRVEKYINSKGRNIIGWDEILEGGLAPNATVMSWRGTKGGIAAAKMNHYTIMTPETPLYLNFSQSRNEDSITQGGYNPIEAVYAYEPIPKELDAAQGKYILGAQGNLWSEYISNTRKLEYMLFPRMSALSEVLWSPASKRNWNEFERRLPHLFKLYQSWGANYSNAYYDLQPSVVPAENGGVAWKLETKNPAGKIIHLKGRTTSATRDYTAPVPILTSGSYGAALTDQQHRIISSWLWQDFYINKASGKKVTLTTMPNVSYGGSGGFTLVDGIQNNMGMVKSSQFLGFLGKDLEAVIDLDSLQQVNNITLHAFEQTASWIYRPASVTFYTSTDGVNFQLVDTITTLPGSRNLLYKVAANTRARFIKVFAKGFGKIPFGSPGSGTNAWLFADEIEVD